MRTSDYGCILAGALFGGILWGAAGDKIVGPLAFLVMLAMGVCLAIGTHVPERER